MQYNFLHIPLQIVTLFAMEYYIFFSYFPSLQQIVFPLQIATDFSFKNLSQSSICDGVHSVYYFSAANSDGYSVAKSVAICDGNSFVANSDGFISVAKSVVICDGKIIRRKFSLRRIRSVAKTLVAVATKNLFSVANF